MGSWRHRPSQPPWIVLLVIVAALSVLTGLTLRVSSSGCQPEQVLDLGSRADLGDGRFYPAASSPNGAVSTSDAAFPGDRFVVFMFYSWNWDMFSQTLRSFQQAGWRNRIVVIDNSPDRKAVKELKGSVAPEHQGVQVVATRTALTFAQLHNVAREMAIEQGLDFYFWGHADVITMGRTASESFSEGAMRCLHEQVAAYPNWGVVWYEYDWFAAYNVKAVKTVAWDNFIPHYKADCDFYHRIRLAGYNTLDCVCGKIFDMSEVVALPDDYQEAMHMLSNMPAASGDTRNAWRDQALDRSELEGRKMANDLSGAYYEAKWGTGACDLPAGTQPWPQPSPPPPQEPDNNAASVHMSDNDAAAAQMSGVS